MRQSPRQAARQLLRFLKRDAKNQHVDEERFLAALQGADARALFGAVQKHRPDDMTAWSFVRHPFFFFRPVIYAGGVLEVYPAPFPAEHRHRQDLLRLKQHNYAVQLWRHHQDGRLPKVKQIPTDADFEPALHHTDRHLRGWAFSELYRIGQPNPSRQKAVLQHLNDGDEAVADWAWLTLFDWLLRDTAWTTVESVQASAHAVPDRRLPLVVACLHLLEPAEDHSSRLPPLRHDNDEPATREAWHCLDLLGPSALAVSESVHAFLGHEKHHWRALALAAFHDERLHRQVVQLVGGSSSIEDGHHAVMAAFVTAPQNAVAVLHQVAHLLDADQLQTLATTGHPEAFAGVFARLGGRAAHVAPFLMQRFAALTDPLTRFELIDVLAVMGGETVFAFLAQEAESGCWVAASWLFRFGEPGLTALARFLAGQSDAVVIETLAAMTQRPPFPPQLAAIVAPFLDHGDFATCLRAARMLLLCDPTPLRLVQIAGFLVTHRDAVLGTMASFHELARPLAHLIAAQLADGSTGDTEQDVLLLEALGWSVPYATPHLALLQQFTGADWPAPVRAVAAAAVTRVLAPEANLDHPFEVNLTEPLVEHLAHRLKET